MRGLFLMSSLLIFSTLAIHRTQPNCHVSRDIGFGFILLKNSTCLLFTLIVWHRIAFVLELVEIPAISIVLELVEVPTISFHFHKVKVKVKFRFHKLFYLPSPTCLSCDTATRFTFYVFSVFPYYVFSVLRIFRISVLRISVFSVFP